MSASTPNTGAEPAVHVVAGIVARDGMIFLTRRPERTHLAGAWEFPGGKLEPGEDAFDGLRRELQEEIGIELLDAQPIVRIPCRYPEKAILLDVWRVTAFRGEPHGREGQSARWARPDDLFVSDFPAADRPVLRRLQLPPLYLITHSAQHGQERFRLDLSRALAAGARLIQLREPGMPVNDYLALARDTASLCHAHQARLLINGDPGSVAACGADGVHLNRHRLMAMDRRPLPADMLVAASCHDADELQQAQRLELDFAVLSPVAATLSHPQSGPLGWERFGALAKSVALPVYALGGMTSADLPVARHAGAQGLAMMRGIWDADSIELAVSIAQRI